jgi:hypothetical protein
VPRLAELAELGVVGFKAFMAPSGVDDFAAADDLTLYDGMAEAARLGLPVAVHAESAALTEGLARRAPGHGWRDYAASRPVSPSSRRSGGRSPSRGAPGAPCTSSTSRRGGASGSSPRRGPRAST